MQQQKNNQLTLGEKIRNFRKRAGLSQLQLETEIDASQGSISRIESGKVNPTKETLAAIAELLKLSFQEKLTLYSLDLGDPSSTETMAAKAQVQEYFSLPETYALLIDNKWNMVAVSKGFLDVFTTLVPDVEAILRAHLLELVFDKSLGLADFIGNMDDFVPDELALFRISHLSRVDEEWYRDLISKLAEFPSFEKYWQSSKGIIEPFLHKGSRHIKLRLGKEELVMRTHFRHLNSDPRFELLDYTLEANHAE